MRINNICDGILIFYLYRRRIYNNCIYYILELDEYYDYKIKKKYYGNYKISEYKSTLA